MRKIVLLPNTKEKLIKQATDTFQKGEFAQTVEIIELLLEHKVQSFELHLNLVISLMKLKEWKDAIHYADEFTALYKKDKKSQFIELIVMSLFEQSNFSQALERIDEALEEGIANDVRRRLEVIRELCHEQNVIIANVMVDEMSRLAKDEKHVELFTTLKKWQQLSVTPPEIFKSFLTEKNIHPIVKTVILEELQKANISTELVIEKFGKSKTVIPNQLENFNQSTDVQKLLCLANDIEHQNPTLFRLIRSLIIQYSYVMYPFNLHTRDNDSLLKAFIIVAKKQLSIEEIDEDINQEISIHIENINICHHLYMSIVDDIIKMD